MCTCVDGLIDRNLRIARHEADDGKNHESCEDTCQTSSYNDYDGVPTRQTKILHTKTMGPSYLVLPTHHVSFSDFAP